MSLASNLFFTRDFEGTIDESLDVLADVEEEGQNLKEIAIVHGALGDLDRWGLSVCRTASAALCFSDRLSG